ncbi:MAG: PAS domain-containing protein, partial [Vulcanimicrobiota bacterium]
MNDNNFLQPDSDFCELLEEIQELFIRIDENGKILLTSPFCNTLLQYKPEEMKGMNLQNLFADSQLYLRFKQKMGTEKKIENFEAELLDKEGRPIWLSIFAKEKNKDSRYIIDCLCTAISQRKKLEKKVTHLLDYFRTVLENAPHAILCADKDMAVIDANKKGMELFGYDYDELVLKKIPELFTSIPEKQQFHFIETIGIKKEEKCFPVLVSRLSVKEQAEPAYFFIIEDMTEKKNSLKLFREKEARLRVAIEASQAGYYEFTSDFSSVLISDSWLLIHGMLREQITLNDKDIFNWWVKQLP